jgi:pimeloyl-ACP methyl ester carboxylesterase
MIYGFVRLSSFGRQGKPVRILLPACLLPFVMGCLVSGPRPSYYRASSVTALAPVGVVFVANGAGDFRTVSENLSDVVAGTATPLQIEPFGWSRGYGRYILDQIDHDNHLAQGYRLASQVCAYRRAYPDRRIYLMGHSAGCAVVLAAAEILPPDSVNRIILLAPSVGRTYDLRPALRTARAGIDVFHSNEDRVILGLGMRIFGTTDGNQFSAAGQFGFIPVIACPADAALYGKLRQHPWHPVVEWSGHEGGHFGNNQAGFLQAYVLPLLVCY